MRLFYGLSARQDDVQVQVCSSVYKLQSKSSAVQLYNQEVRWFPRILKSPAGAGPAQSTVYRYDKTGRRDEPKLRWRRCHVGATPTAGTKTSIYVLHCLWLGEELCLRAGNSWSSYETAFTVNVIDRLILMPLFLPAASEIYSRIA